MILIERYDVLEKSLNQKFEKCGDNGSTLFIARIDVVAFIAVRLAQKRAIVRCNSTAKFIPKKQWNSETVSEANNLLDQHKTPKLGFILISLIFLGLFAGITYNIIHDRNSSIAYKQSFIAKSKNEQSQILEKLGENDLLLIGNEIYRIKSSNNEKVVLEKSLSKIDPNKINSFKPIDESLVPDNSYHDSFEIKKEDFIKNIFVVNNSGVMITQYLDR